ncbi:FkbM family methyltransferase [Arcobacter cryaerophilus gv. pseudocryaerophilus]|uniref:FkbM family methyltransferase n=3 Tax=Arcobacteraceae TaxID=2808963 RepID=A0AA96IJR2_9BACT|nr:FkbM family methyltransferase [Arcobacter sp. AZ-2023]WNL35393.1 FkbM family methyltransferase [Arcobacter sp. AZ-2023]WPD11109.1 FkbM family methyltransferase [Arcobacter sp. DSM 115960]
MQKWQLELNKILNSNFLEPNPLRQISLNGFVLYGAGAMGKMAMDFLECINKLPLYIVDQQITGYIKGIKIIKPQEIPNKDKTILTFFVCIATLPLNYLYKQLNRLGCVDVRHFYDLSEHLFPQMMSNGWIAKDIQKNELTYILYLLEHDNYSVAHYLQFLWWRLKRKEKIDINYPVLSNKKFFNAPCLPILENNEKFLDGGAHHGKTILSFLEKTDFKYDMIWAFEPDTNNLKILRESINNNIEVYDKALWYTCDRLCFQDNFCYASKLSEDGNFEINSVSIDSLQINPTVIKLHVEGSEYEVLIGAYETIKRSRPIIMVLADHSQDGMFNIPHYLAQFESYNIYFYLHDFCGNSAVYYAIPKERDKIKKAKGVLK